jgi:hypothetical protein
MAADVRHALVILALFKLAVAASATPAKRAFAGMRRQEQYSPASERLGQPGRFAPSTWQALRLAETLLSGAMWRRGGDSNPRYPYEYAAFRVRCFQPLSHLSRRLVERGRDN